MTAATGFQVGYGPGFNNYPPDYQVPLTGFSITPVASKTLLNPAGTLATGTITMPASPDDGTVVGVSTTQTVTSLTVSANTGQSINNAVTTLTAGSTVSYIYRATDKTWYKNP